MDAPNANRFTMLLAVHQFPKNHSALLSTMPLMTRLKDDRDALETEIRTPLATCAQENAGLPLFFKACGKQTV